MGIEQYLPDSVRNWIRPNREKRESQTTDQAPERSGTVSLSEIEANPERYVVAEYSRVSEDGTERNVRLLKSSETQGDVSTKEGFILQADVGKNEDGMPKYETIGVRAAQFNKDDRRVYFETTQINEKYRGGGLGTDTYKAFIDYANKRAKEIDGQSGNTSKEPWSVMTAPESPVTRHQFEKFFQAKDQGMVMVGTLRTLDSIETEERLNNVRDRIEKITSKRAA